jgi:hypothetical protein
MTPAAEGTETIAAWWFASDFSFSSHIRLVQNALHEIFFIFLHKTKNFGFYEIGVRT